MDLSLLKKIGLSDKEAKIYQILVSSGPSSVRGMAELSGLNRGTVHDSLKLLQAKRLINFYKENKQYFVAENPERIRALLDEKEEETREMKMAIEKILPELIALHHSGKKRPIAKYYGKEEIKDVLEDVLKVCEDDSEKIYRVYSAGEIRNHVYQDFPSFSDARVAKGVKVRVIAVGKGGQLRGLDERKWLEVKKEESSLKPSYIIIYPGKVAHISLDEKQEPIGVLVENSGISETQKLLFDALWEKI